MRSNKVLLKYLVAFWWSSSFWMEKGDPPKRVFNWFRKEKNKEKKIDLLDVLEGHQREVLGDDYRLFTAWERERVE